MDLTDSQYVLTLATHHQDELRVRISLGTGKNESFAIVFLVVNFIHIQKVKEFRAILHL